MSTEPLTAEERLAFVNFVRLWWHGPNGLPVVAAGSQEVADEDFEDMERDLASLGLRLAAASEEPRPRSEGDINGVRTSAGQTLLGALDLADDATAIRAVALVMAIEAEALAGSPRSDAVLDRPATFPLDVATFTAGLDSPNHSPESRKAWIALFFRDMKRSAALPSPRSDDREGTR